MSKGAKLLLKASEMYGPEVQALIEQRCRRYNTDRNRYWDYIIELMDVDSLEPTQSGEDYCNDSSIETARKIASGAAISSRIEDILPILIDEKGQILDGNHRHCAAKINEDKEIWTLRADPESVKTNKGVGKVINWEYFLSPPPEIAAPKGSAYSTPNRKVTGSYAR